MRMHTVRYHTTLGLFVLCGLAPLAHGQNALGDGRALEARLEAQIPAGTSAVRRTFSNELAFRESIVTGTAPSGLSFRGGTLPSQFEFRGDLSEDSLYAFRRDSLYSGLAGQGIRGTDALQYQFALTVGGRVPASLSGQLSYARAGAAERGFEPDQPLVRDLASAGGGLRRVVDADLMVTAIDAGSSLLQPVRSISSYTANHGLQPTLVGLMQNKVTQQTAGQTASPLLGVQVVPVGTLRDSGAVPKLNTGATTSPALAPEASEPTKPAYEQLLDRFRELTVPEPAPAPGDTPSWAKQLIGLQRVLRGMPESTTRAMGLTPGEEGEEGEEGGDIGRIAEGLPSIEDPEAEPVLSFDREVLRRVREAGGLTDTLIATDLAHIDRYTAFMQSGQQMLANERYFDAEEMFISALTFREQDVTASIGRTHAQLGAGLFLSAGLNLRQLLVRHPETAGMRYGAELLTSATRMDQIAYTLRHGLDQPTTGADSGLLLAYLGFQRGQADDTRAGLEALAALGDEADRRLAEMLEVVWLDDGAVGEEETPTGSP